MTKQVQRRRGTATQHTSFTGAEGEISVNTTNKSIHVHDGVTAGGIEGARADMTNVSDGDLNSRLAGNTLSSLTITSADINGGTIDGTVIGGSTPAAGSFTTGSFTGNVSFGDNDKAIFGAGSDLQIYHDGSNSYIKDAGTGVLNVQGSSQVNIGGANGTIGVQFVEGANVTLRHNNSPKLATTSTGIDVTGTVTADGLTVDNNANNTFKLRRDNSLSPFGSVDVQSISGGTTYYSGALEHYNGQWRIQTQTASTTRSPLNRATFDANGNIHFYEDTGTTPKLTWDASAESLGIGTTTANETLVLNKAANNNFLKFETAGTARAYIGASTLSGGGLTGSTAGDLIIRSEAGIAIGSGGSSNIDMRIDSSGNVGIGMPPSGALSVRPSGTGSEDSHIGFGANLDAYITTGSNGVVVFREGNGAGANTERMRIDSSGNVGIGVVPSSVLHVKASTPVFTLQGTAVGNATTPFISAVDSNSDVKWRVGNLSTGTPDLYISSNGGGTRFTTGSGYTEAMRIDSSGNLLVGTTVNSIDTEGALVRSSGQISACVDGSYGAVFQRKTSDGDIVLFRKDGATVGSIGIQSSGFIIDGEASHSGLRFTSAGITPRLNKAESDNTVNLGESGVRFKDLYLSGGVYLGGTGAANKLDDYETGTWTPVLPNGGTIGNVVTGIYTKVGRIVHVELYIQTINPTANTSVFQIGGLPFNCGGGYEVGSIGYTRNGDLSNLSIGVQNYSDYLYFHHIDGTTSARLTNNNWIARAGGEYLIASITYQTT